MRRSTPFGRLCRAQSAFARTSWTPGPCEPRAQKPIPECPYSQASHSVCVSTPQDSTPGLGFHTPGAAPLSLRMRLWHRLGARPRQAHTPSDARASWTPGRAQNPIACRVQACPSGLSTPGLGFHTRGPSALILGVSCCAFASFHAPLCQPSARSFASTLSPLRSHHRPAPL